MNYLLYSTELFLKNGLTEWNVKRLDLTLILSDSPPSDSEAPSVKSED
jgi:hypothetical protein